MNSRECGTERDNRKWPCTDIPLENWKYRHGRGYRNTEQLREIAGYSRGISMERR